MASPFPLTSPRMRIPRLLVVSASAFLTACTLAIVQPTSNSSVTSPVRAVVQWSPNVSLDAQSFTAQFDGGGLPMGTTTNMDPAQSTWTASIPAPAGSHTLTVAGDLSTFFGAFSNHDQRSVAFQVAGPPPTPPPPPSSVNSVSPTSGVIGTDVTVSGAGFDPAHVVTLGSTTVASRFVSATEIHFNAPQLQPASYPVAVAGVGAVQFTIVAGSLTASPSPLSAIVAQSTALTISLPQRAPPGGVALSVAAAPAGIVQISTSGSVNPGSAALSANITGQGIGSGSLAVSGTGFNTLSVPFVSALGPPQCTARASATGGVDLIGITSGQVVAHLPAQSTPGRIVASPDGTRAAAQFTDGASLIDLVRCSSSSALKFIQTSVPFQDLTYSSDSAYLVADWSSQAGAFGVAAYETLAGDTVLDDASSGTPTAVGVTPATDGTQDYVLATFFPSGPPIMMTIYRLAKPHGSQCSLGQVPSNSFNVMVTGGQATIQFLGIAPPQTWVVDAATCHVISRT